MSGQQPPPGTRPRLLTEGAYFAQLWEAVLFDHRLRPASRMLYAILQRVAARYGPLAVMPSHQELADLADLSRDTVSTCLAELAQAGHIKRRRRVGYTDEVVLIAPETAGTSAVDALFSRVMGEQTHALKPRSGAGDAEKVGSAPEMPISTGEGAENVRGVAEKFRGVAEKSGNPAEDFRNPYKEDTESTEKTESNSLAPAKTRGRPAYTQEFLAFWETYPRTNGTKVEAFKEWRLLGAEDRAAARAGLEKWLRCDLWRAGKIVYAERYLRRRMWEEEPAPEPGCNGHAAAFRAYAEAESVISAEERAALEARRREALARSGETAEERWARLHPQEAAKVAPIRAQSGAGGR